MRENLSLVDESEAIAQAGHSPEIAQGRSVTYAFGPEALVIIVDAGDRPHGNAVSDTDEITLREPFPGHSGEWLLAEGPSTPPFHCFVRMTDGCLALGEVAVFGGIYGENAFDSQAGEWKRSRPKRITLELKEQLPQTLLDQIRVAAAAPLSGVAWLDILPTDRISALRAFLTGWYADLPVSSRTATPAPMPLPPALSSFYETAAAWPEILGRQDFVLPPSELEYADGEPLIIFAAENQGVWEALIDPAENDPPSGTTTGINAYPNVSRSAVSSSSSPWARPPRLRRSELSPRRHRRRRNVSRNG